MVRDGRGEKLQETPERIVNSTRKPNPFERFAERIGASFGAAVVKAMELEISAVLR